MLALARKHRPRNFASVAVQTHVANTLKGAIARGRVAHGYLLCGPRGTGKTTLARVLAMALNCERKGEDGEPCGACTSCTRIWSGAASLDVVEIDAASNRGVDDARDLRERAMYAPSGDDRYKVYIVDEAHMLTREAWNTLLKVLEEPPPRVVFVFATTEPQKIAQAAAPVLSRLQRFDLKRIAGPEIRTRVGEILALEGIEAEPDALAMIARAADGSMRDALSLTDQVLAFGDTAVRADAVRLALGLVAEDELLEILDHVAERRPGSLFAVTGRLADAGADFALLLGGFADVLRGQLAAELGAVIPETSERMRTAFDERRGRLSAGELVRMLSLLVEHEPIVRKSAHPQLLFESLLVRFALMDRTVAIEDVLRQMSGGGAAPSAPGASRPARREAAAPDGQRNAARDSFSRDSVAAEQRRDDVDLARAVPRARQAAAEPEPVPPPPVPPEDAGGGAFDAVHGAPPERRPARAAAPAPPLADAPPRAAAQVPLDLNRLAERWDDIVAQLRTSGKGLVAQLLEESTPSAVTASGTITLDAESAMTLQGLAEAERSVLQAIASHFSGVTKLAPRLAGSARRPRYDAESVRAERVASLRGRDPLLAAAIDALDLELLE